MFDTAGLVAPRQRLRTSRARVMCGKGIFLLVRSAPYSLDAGLVAGASILVRERIAESITYVRRAALVLKGGILRNQTPLGAMFLIATF